MRAGIPVDPWRPDARPAHEPVPPRSRIPDPDPLRRVRRPLHDEIIRLRNAHPDQSLEALAHRLGCSLSTVKRHLRQERDQPSVRRSTRRPTMAEVVSAAAGTTGRRPARSRAA